MYMAIIARLVKSNKFLSLLILEVAEVKFSKSKILIKRLGDCFPAELLLNLCKLVSSDLITGPCN